MLKSDKGAYIWGLTDENCDIKKKAEKYASYRQFKERPTTHWLYAPDLNNFKGKKNSSLLDMNQQKQASQAYQHKLSNDDLHTSVDEIRIKLVAYYSIIGF